MNDEFFLSQVGTAVIGAGHAGIEAALASARMGVDTVLFTLSLDALANMPCNPSIGGTGKGHLVCEIDALGGRMARITDLSTIQFRMLNRSKGAAMWSPRAQSDRAKFIQEWRAIIENTPNLYLWQDSVNELIIKDKTVCGVKTQLGVEFFAKTVVITSGTFLN